MIHYDVQQRQIMYAVNLDVHSSVYKIFHIRNFPFLPSSFQCRAFRRKSYIVMEIGIGCSKWKSMLWLMFGHPVHVLCKEIVKIWVSLLCEFYHWHASAHCDQVSCKMILMCMLKRGCLEIISGFVLHRPSD